MSEVRRLVAELIALGVDACAAAEIIAAAVKEGATQKPVDSAAERRRAYDRDRQQAKRDAKKADNPPTSTGQKTVKPDPSSTGQSADSTGLSEMRDIEDISTTSSNKQTIPQRAPYPPEFQELWDLFPRKVGKDDALRSWKKVRGRIEHDALKTAISKHAALVAGKEKQFIPHPATWLNDGRWQDEDLQPPKPLALVSGGKVWVAYGTEEGDLWEAFYKKQGKIAPRDGKNGWWQESKLPPYIFQSSAA